ncbi:Glyceraldehyde-3-Phosphate Dehydrogenase [Manis pentadactyla]|nr:Glyceraldehyde-3-Phosphate Dehydrogenase [Manis pentadactyla]
MYARNTTPYIFSKVAATCGDDHAVENRLSFPSLAQYVREDEWGPAQVVDEMEVGARFANIKWRKAVDGSPGKLWHSGSGVAQNVISDPTLAAKAVGKVNPELNGKLPGMTSCVPAPVCRVMDRTCHLEKVKNMMTSRRW